MPSSFFDRPDLILLVFGAFAACLSYNVFRPIRSTLWIGTVSFFLGWLTGELAMHHIVLQLAALMYFVYQGALSSAAGWAGAMLLVVSIAMLVRYHESGHRVGTETIGAFDAAGIATPAATRVSRRALVRPFHMRRRKVVVERGLEAANVDGTVLPIDVFHRGDSDGRAPVIIYIHGGAWVIGYKQYQGLPILNELAERGFVCMSASYRLSPRATFPEHVHDIYRAVAWARANAARFGGDPNRIVLCGNSAGGHLAAIAVLGHREPRLRPPELGAEVDLSSIAGISIYGVFDVLNRHRHWPGNGVRALMRDVVLKTTPEADPDLYRLASPIDLIDERTPPFLVIHGSNDSLVPVQESRRFVDKLRERSAAPCVYIEVEGAQHAFDIFNSIRGAYSVNSIVSFLERVTTAETAYEDESPSIRAADETHA